MMIEPESITVPSKSKRTTGKRMRSIVPSRISIHALEIQPPGRAVMPASTRGGLQQSGQVAALQHRADEVRTMWRRKLSARS
jgi:hypothetical protein